MDITQRKITKIAREAEKLVLLTVREEGVGTAEIDLIHALRHHPGCTQAQLAELLHADKAAIARRTKNLEGKGYLTRQDAAIQDVLAFQADQAVQDEDGDIVQHAVGQTAGDDRQNKKNKCEVHGLKWVRASMPDCVLVCI